MPAVELISLAESCSQLRAAIGRMLLCEQSAHERDAAEEQYRRALRDLLNIARREECGLFLEVAGELPARR